MQWLTNLIVKVIPSNWYTTKKACDIITKVCDTITDLRWFVFPTIVIIIVGVTVVFVYFCKLKIMRLRYRMVRKE
jgi:hypothetical protein